jgi:hypothetical protein
MAKTKTEGMARIFQIAAVLGIGAFFYWLYVASEPTEFLVAEDDVAEIEATPLTGLDFAEDPLRWEGEAVRFDHVEVTQLMRQNVYFVRIGEEGILLLTRMSNDLAGTPGFQPLPGDRGYLVGTIQEVTEELIDQWNQAGVFRDAQELLQAQTQPSYMFVTRAELQAPDRPEGDDEEANDDTDA